MKPVKHHSWFEVEQGEIEKIPFCRGAVTHFSQRCPTRELSPNQDAACLIQLTDMHGVLAVADGVGGASAGNKAARMAIEQLLKHVATASPGVSARSQILNAIEDANQSLLQWGTGSASTLAVVEYLDNEIRTYHVGDATVILTSNHGRIKYCTVAHAPVALAVELGMLNEQEALRHDDRNLISNFVGSHEMKIEIGPELQMAARDSLIIASDGLFDNLTTAEVVEKVCSGPLLEKTDQLVQLAAARMRGSLPDQSQSLPSKPDDLTVLCFRQFG